MLRQVVFLCILHTVFTVSNNDFCNLKCGRQHTVCQRKPCSISPACGAGAKALPLNDENRKWILHVHNRLRNGLALGKDTRGGNSQAANMHVLNYDKEMEYVAQCWANACMEGGTAHDRCRETKKFSLVGQNMYSMGSSNSRDYTANEYLTKAVEAWYSEISLTTLNEIDNYKGMRDATGHFENIVWAETTHIGCGRTFFISKIGYYSVYIYCNYARREGVPNKSIYSRGRPCSQCGKNTCNKQYPGLCGEIESFYKGTSGMNKVEDQIPIKESKLIPQLPQNHGHKQKNCHKEAGCVKCTGKHLTKGCRKQKNGPDTTALTVNKQINSQKNSDDQTLQLILKKLHKHEQMFKKFNERLILLEGVIPKKKNVL